MTPDNAGSASESDAGTPAAATGANDQGSNSGASDPFVGLETGTRDWVEKAGIKDIASLAAKARNAESLIGRSVQLPGDDAKPEDVDKYILKATEKYRPKEPDGYEFKLPEGVPKDMPYDAEFAKGFKGEAHKLGLTAKQATALHDFYVGSAAKVFSGASDKVKADADAAEKQYAENAVAATQALEKEFGKRDSPEFKTAVETIERTVKSLGGDGLWNDLVEMKVIDANGLVLRPNFAVAMHKASALFKEDKLESGTSAGGADNPFMGTNVTLQMQAIRADRAGALRLISAAGKQPSDFGLSTT